MTEWTAHRLHLTPDERRELLRVVRRGYGDGGSKVIETLLPTAEDDVYELIPGPFVGRFALESGRVLDIRSRLITDGDLAGVLQVTGRLPSRLDNKSTPGGEGWGIVDVIARALAREVELIIGHGLAKAYQRQRFTSPHLPGTIDVGEHISRHGGRPDKLVTVARRLTTDIQRNQALAAATHVLLGLTLQPTARLNLRRIAAALAGVSTPKMDSRTVEQLLGGPRLGRYDRALQLCALVLRRKRVGFDGDGLTGASILFRMPEVWEDFVTAWARDRHPGMLVSTQYGFPLLNDRASPAVRADVVVHDVSGQLLSLFDAKYKEPPAVPAASDVYQMVSYCERLGLDQATLVYPGEGAPSMVSIGNRRIHTVQLNVSRLLQEQLSVQRN